MNSEDRSYRRWLLILLAYAILFSAGIGWVAANQSSHSPTTTTTTEGR